MHEAYVWAKRSSEAVRRLDPSQHTRALRVPHGLKDVIPMGTQPPWRQMGGARYVKDVLLLVRVELFPFRGESKDPPG
jgi:hypothetical protein